MELHDAVEQLGRFTHELRWSELQPRITERARDVLLDTIGVTLAGARTPELRALHQTVVGDEGPSRPLGAERGHSVTTAAWLDGTAVCTLELDEGNKRARGHPAAHVLPAALALAPVVRVDGDTWLSAFVAGHEVAARFAAASSLHPGVHPHGNAGTAGAAAAAARLLSLDAHQTAAAIDAATSLPLATDFDAALDGSFVRNTWIGQANASGIAAARLAAADLAQVDGRAAGTLGRMLGELDVAMLVDGLGETLAVTDGYFKRHAACSYTHPPADAVLSLRDEGLRCDRIDRVEVRTHRLAAPLDRTATPSRLAAMFSIPYVVAATMVRGSFDVTASDAATRADPEIRRLAEATTVIHEPAYDDRLPNERVAAVTAYGSDGERWHSEVPNPVGDSSYRPLTHDDIRAKLEHLLDPGETSTIVAVLDALPGSHDAAEHIADLP